MLRQPSLHVRACSSFVLTKRPKKVLEQSAFAVQSDVDGFLKNADARYFTKPLKHV